jgi:hypothetical protein
MWHRVLTGQINARARQYFTCAAITESDVVLSEELVDLVRQVDAIRPGFARKLSQIVRPEELAFLREAGGGDRLCTKVCTWRRLGWLIATCCPT